MKSFPFVSLVLFVAAFGLSACSYQKNKIPDPTDEEIPAELLNSVSYAMVSAKVFQPYCVSCHGSSGGVNLESYASAKSVLGRINQAALISKSMPKAPSPALSHDDAQVLAAWVKMGGAGNSSEWRS